MDTEGGSRTDQMRIADLVEIREIARALDLANLRQIRDSLDAEGGAPSVLTASDLNEILAEYLPLAGPDHDPLHNLLEALVSDLPTGAGFIVQGPAGSGKTHLLCVAALLLEYRPLRHLFGQSHADFAEVLHRLDRKPAPLVVPVSLQEHRAEDEHLEDIIFDCVERELGRPRYQLQVPLSEQSYALDLINRHILPRYQRQLDAHVSERHPRCATWEKLVKRDRAAAVGAAQSFAQTIGYPLDFRQSRVERMARLSEVIQSRDVSGIVWLIDDLWQFLAGAGHKAVRNDIAFLEFLGQRTKLDRLYLLLTMRAGLEELSGIEPYILAGIRDSYEASYRLDALPMRRVAHTRAIKVVDESGFEEAVGRVSQAYRQAFGEPSFTTAELAASYPLHPTAEPMLERVYQKYFAEGDALVDFLQILRRAEETISLDRDYRLLVSLPEIFDLLSSRLAAHPRAADYVREVLDYYEKNAARIAPEHADAVLHLTKTLILLSLANMPAAAGSIVELIGLDEQGNPLVSATVAGELLEQMRLRGNYVDLRGGVAEDIYIIDVHTNLSELAHHRLMTARSGLLESDPRLWRAGRSAASGPDFPLAHFDQAKMLEVIWQNTARFVSVETADLTTITAQQLKDQAAELASVESESDCRIFIAELLAPEAQLEAFRQAAEAAADHAFADGVIAWVPRVLSETELDKLRQLAACQQILREPSTAQEQPEVSDRIAEEAATLEPEVARIVAKAYRDGYTITAGGHEAAVGAAAQAAATWSELLAAVVANSLSQIFPDFAGIAPRRLVSGTRLVDRLVEGLIRPGAVSAEADSDLAAMAEDVLGPLGLIERDGDRLVVEVSKSAVAGEVMNRVRQRDTTPQTERGRPVSYADLGAHLAKSAAGLTPEIFELTVACLLETGWLVAIGADANSVPVTNLAGPVRNCVQQVARAPLLSMAEWRSVTRLSKMVLNTSVPRPDHSTQTSIYAGLLSASELSLKRIAAMKAHLAQLQEMLGQAPSQWQQAHAVLDELAKFFEMIDPALMPAEGLKKLVSQARSFVEQEAGPSRLAHLLREVNAVWEFFDSTAGRVVAMRDYLVSESLCLDQDADLRTRQQRLLSLIGTGEQIITESGTFGRLAQIFMATYKRRYLNWHGRCNRPSIFERYRTLRASPELRALAQLQRLDLKVEGDAGRAFEVLEAELQRRCEYEALGAALDSHPVCPNCHLRLDVEPDLVPPEAILELAQAGIRAYLEAMKGAEFSRLLAQYTAGLPNRGELAGRLDRVLHLDAEANARLILTLFNDEVIAHLNRMLSGKRLRSRDFGQLRELLSGRTMPAEEAMQLFERWLQAGDDDEEDGGELVHIEP